MATLKKIYVDGVSYDLSGGGASICAGDLVIDNEGSLAVQSWDDYESMTETEKGNIRGLVVDPYKGTFIRCRYNSGEISSPKSTGSSLKLYDSEDASDNTCNGTLLKNSFPEKLDYENGAIFRDYLQYGLKATGASYNDVFYGLSTLYFAANIDVSGIASYSTISYNDVSSSNYVPALYEIAKVLVRRNGISIWDKYSEIVGVHPNYNFFVTTAAPIGNSSTCIFSIPANSTDKFDIKSTTCWSLSSVNSSNFYYEPDSDGYNVYPIFDILP